ncbi:PREDICTED: epidermal growth factor-like protein 7 isoform X2 [Miniopterus natalensis]|uniref:epidermal growth factor-like protein 7 isoform X2 n=1 Tax=Miniopterus natalensis TaxID=291302 RepID=UPI0007A6DBBF|nr:PREDICTED: epidermal growth factor-like protein 7 isoform X2 [Miniopterus natalensis]
MWGCRELLLVWFLVLAAGGTEHVYRPGRRVCAVGVPQGPVSESFVQRVYQPFLTTCDGHRVCSTYRTIYKTAYRRSPGLAPPRPHYACCPGWKRTGGVPRACRAAICQPPCQNGGSCVQPGRCRCPAGWQGDSCQTGVDREVKEEVQRLRSRVDVLEQKLQLVLAPLHSLASRALEHGLPDPSSFLAHSFQQLDRIDSLSEQISFLEEQLGSCECLVSMPTSPPTMPPSSLSCPELGPVSAQRGQRVGLGNKAEGAHLAELTGGGSSDL